MKYVQLSTALAFFLLIYGGQAKREVADSVLAVDGEELTTPAEKSTAHADAAQPKSRWKDATEKSLAKIRNAFNRAQKRKAFKRDVIVSEPDIRTHFVHFDCNGVLMAGDAAKDISLQHGYQYHGFSKEEQLAGLITWANVEFFEAGDEIMRRIGISNSASSRSSQPFHIKPIIRTFGNDMPDIIEHFKKLPGLTSGNTQKMQLYWHSSKDKKKPFLDGTHLVAVMGWVGDDKVEVCRNKENEVLTLDDLLLLGRKPDSDIMFDMLITNAKMFERLMQDVIARECKCVAPFLTGDTTLPGCPRNEAHSLMHPKDNIVVRLTTKKQEIPQLKKKKLALMTPGLELSVDWENMNQTAKKAKFIERCEAVDQNCTAGMPHDKPHDIYGQPIAGVESGGCKLQEVILKNFNDAADMKAFCGALFKLLWAKATAQANMVREMKASMKTKVKYSFVSVAGDGEGSLQGLFDEFYSAGPHQLAFVRDDAGFQTGNGYNKIKIPKEIDDAGALAVFKWKAIHGNGKAMVARVDEQGNFLDAFFDDNVFKGIVSAFDFPNGKRLFMEPQYRFSESPTEVAKDVLECETVSFPGSQLDEKFKLNPLTQLQNARPLPLLQVPEPKSGHPARDNKEYYIQYLAAYMNSAGFTDVASVLVAKSAVVAA